jgi:hypothetical protein
MRIDRIGRRTLRHHDVSPLPLNEVTKDNQHA